MKTSRINPEMRMGLGGLRGLAEERMETKAISRDHAYQGIYQYRPPDSCLLCFFLFSFNTFVKWHKLILDLSLAVTITRMLGSTLVSFYQWERVPHEWDLARLLQPLEGLYTDLQGSRTLDSIPSEFGWTKLSRFVFYLGFIRIIWALLLLLRR